ncbi:MAG: uroporphyrinogen-III C-methyltransferase [Psychromonas sp.]
MMDMTNKQQSTNSSSFSSKIRSINEHSPANYGLVSLVGAGPGDPELLTVKALRIIQTADVIIFDNLVSKKIRQLFPKETETIYVGKAKGNHSLTQTQINQLLMNKAKKGLDVCRLKGGDAFIFGRGGEEMLTLKKQSISVQIVPGITAATGCASYAGIPLTHRGLSQGCTFVTAHAEKTLDIKWKALAQLDHTLIFYMGLSKAQLIQTQLIQAGLDENTEVALIENGCCEQQRVITGKLNQLAALVIKEQVQSPSLIMIGKVVALSQQLQWFNEQVTMELAIDQLTQLTA